MEKHYKMTAYNSMEGITSPTPEIYRYEIKNEFNHFTVGDLENGCFHVWLNVTEDQHQRLLAIDGISEA